MIKLTLTCALAVVALAGCGGGSDGSLTEGVYTNDVSAKYLTENGFTAEHAAEDGGSHTLTLANGSFTDTWTNSKSEKVFCSGTYQVDGGRVTFTWIWGCFGDWSAAYSVDGDKVTWSDAKALPPHDSAEDQRQAEIYNGAPWTRTADSQ